MHNLEPARGSILHCRQLFRGLLLVAAGIHLLAMAAAPVHGGRYEQRFNYAAGTVALGDGSALVEDFSETGNPAAGVRDDTQRELQLTGIGVTGTRSAFLLPNLDPGADGFSLSFGSLPEQLETGAHLQEDGFGTGLTIGVRTFSGTVGGQPNNPGLRAWVNGSERAFNAGPAWGTNSGVRHYWEVDWSASSGLTLRIDGQTYLDRVPTKSFNPAADMQFAFAARTGGFTQEVRLDNLAVVTGGTLQQVPMANATASSQNAPNEVAANTFDNKPGLTGITPVTASAPTGPNNTKWLMFGHVGMLTGSTADGAPHTVTGDRWHGLKRGAVGTGSATEMALGRCGASPHTLTSSHRKR